MVAVHHLEFLKMCSFAMRPLPACRSASSYQILLKSDNRLMSYGQKVLFKMATATILNFINFNVWSRDSHRV